MYTMLMRLYWYTALTLRIGWIHPAIEFLFIYIVDVKPEKYNFFYNEITKWGTVTIRRWLSIKYKLKILIGRSLRTLSWTFARLQDSRNIFSKIFKKWIFLNCVHQSRTAKNTNFGTLTIWLNLGIFLAINSQRNRRIQFATLNI